MAKKKQREKSHEQVDSANVRAFLDMQTGNEQLKKNSDSSRELSRQK